MARARRIVEPGGIYHVAPRGNDGRTIFLDDHDRESHLSLLGRVAVRHRWTIYGYCLMTNHTHVLIQVPEATLSNGMQQLLSGYSRRWNERHGHSGHLFRNRFTSRQGETQSHLLAAVRYIDLNPVRAGLVSAPEAWRWSSYRAHVGLVHPPAFLDVGGFLPLFGPTPALAVAAYRAFVQEGPALVSDAGFKP